MGATCTPNANLYVPSSRAMPTKQNVITYDLMDAAMRYPDFARKMEQLVVLKRTSGPRQSDQLAHYTMLNLKRMQRWEKSMKLEPAIYTALNRIQEKTFWLVITEAWCGDAPHVLPFIGAIAQGNEHIELRVIWRDAHPEVMDRYLTGGSRSIPILVALDNELNDLGHWGPRPVEPQALVLDNKAAPEDKKKSYDELNNELQQWYNHDKGLSLQSELLTVLGEWYG